LRLERRTAMPIYHHAAGTTLTGEAIDFYRLAMIRSGLKLEINGIRLTRGVSCYALAKKELGFKGNKAKVLAQLEDYIAVMRLKVQHVDETVKNIQDGGEAN
jgi:hypothetical protein